MKAAFFDVGDTLVEHWLPREEVAARCRTLLLERYGERPWHDAWVTARLEPEDLAEVRQDTLGWYRAWFEANGIDHAEVDLDELRRVMTLPLDGVSTPVPGAFEALRWCKANGLRVVLVTNTLSRGDEEVVEDWRRFGLHDVIDGVVSSHTVGWRKPHRAMYDRALELAGCGPSEAFMVGDNRWADIWGAKQLGLRAIWRRTPRGPRAPEADVTPDATIDTLEPLPAVVAPWLSQ